jgi:hypothetical protein
MNDARRLAQIFLHKTGGAQMSPRETRLLEIFLDFFMHETKWERGLRPRIQTRELDHVANACGFAGVYKRALRFDQIHAGT